MKCLYVISFPIVHHKFSFNFFRNFEYLVAVLNVNLSDSFLVFFIIMALIEMSDKLAKAVSHYFSRHDARMEIHSSFFAPTMRCRII